MTSVVMVEEVIVFPVRTSIEFESRDACEDRQKQRYEVANDRRTPV